MENHFFIVSITFYIYLNASQYDNIYFYLPYFHVSNGALFLHITLTLHRRSLDTVYKLYH